MKILLLCVNYNTKDSLIEYLLSVKKSLDQINNVFLEIVVVDNSDTPIEIDNLSTSLDLQYVFTGKNLGYLGAISYAIEENHILLTEYDYFMISNVDVTVDSSFFKVLSTLRVPTDVAWIAPSIYSNYEKRDRNPQRICRPTLRRLKLISYLYKYPFLDWMYTNTFYRLKRNEQEYIYDIYTGHGSFMIFTQNLAHTGFQLKFPSFLFGEELYLAELIRTFCMKCIYFPNLKVYDKEHVSTSKLKKQIYYKWNYESIMILINSFWRETK